VIDLVDVDSQKWMTLARRAAPLQKWVYAREARTLAEFERRAAGRARAVLVVNENEEETLRTIAPHISAHVIGNGIDVAAFAPPDPPVEAPTVVFCGVMDYAPNVEAVEWFSTRVWPAIRAARPDARLLVVGANPTRGVTALGRRDPSIAVTGKVDAVQPYLWRAAVSVAPLRVARGVQNKVLEALAAGLPTVVTPAVRAGLPAGVERGCLVASEPEAFARSVVGLLDQPGARRRDIAALACVETLGWPARLASLSRLVEAAAAESPGRLLTVGVPA
jgi:polysaccharide biosynthesis protein PslH